MDRERLLDVVGYGLNKLLRYASLEDAPPVALVGFPQHADHGTIKVRCARNSFQHLFGRHEVLLNGLHHRREQMLKEKHDSFDV